ncbi:MAG: CdaR family protein [Candidatus Firestonebacteria bacterium]
MPKKIKLDKALEIIKGWFLKNPSIKLVALIAALSAWALVAIDSNTKAVISVPLKVSDNEKLVIQGDIPSEVSVTIWGPNDIVRTLGPSQIRLWLDTGNAKKGENRFELGQKNILLPNKVTLLDMEPKFIKLEFVDQKPK